MQSKVRKWIAGQSKCCFLSKHFLNKSLLKHKMCAHEKLDISMRKVLVSMQGFSPLTKEGRDSRTFSLLVNAEVLDEM